MNTPAHLIIGAAAFGKAARPATLWAALAGAFVPDLSLYLMAGVSLFVLGISPQRVFGELYYSDAWQQVFAIDNSFVLWGIAFALAVWRRAPLATAFTGAALLHLALDFPLHNHDARMHFWPLTEWKFISPISYWQGSRGGDIVGAVEITLCAALLIILVRRFKTLGARLSFAALALAEAATTQIWRLVF